MRAVAQGAPFFLAIEASDPRTGQILWAAVGPRSDTPAEAVASLAEVPAHDYEGVVLLMDRHWRILGRWDADDGWMFPALRCVDWERIQATGDYDLASCPLCLCRRSGYADEPNGHDECCDDSGCPCHLDEIPAAVALAPAAGQEA